MGCSYNKQYKTKQPWGFTYPKKKKETRAFSVTQATYYKIMVGENYQLRITDHWHFQQHK